MEWQAGWVSGAILMPASALRTWSAECAAQSRSTLPFVVNTREGGELIKLVADRCDVSELAARVRLIKLRLVVED